MSVPLPRPLPRRATADGAPAPLPRREHAKAGSRPLRQRAVLPTKPEAIIYRAVGSLVGQLKWNAAEQRGRLLLADQSVPIELSGRLRALFRKYPQQLDQLSSQPHTWRFWPAYRHRRLFLWLIGWDEASAQPETPPIKVCGFVKDWQPAKEMVNVWVGRNQPIPEGAGKDPCWQTKKLWLQGIPPRLTWGWWEFDCELTEYGELAIAQARCLHPYMPRPTIRKR
jgi:hypothetical protein